MTDFTMEEAMKNPSIRRYELQGEYYFNVIDILAELRHTDYKTAQNFYHVLKNRIIKNGVEIPSLKRMKAKSLDGKSYFTDFVGPSGFIFIVDYIRPNLQKENYRVSIRQDDEIRNFHPEIIAFFEKQGWQVDHHVRLAFGSQIDMLAVAANELLIQGMFIIECKPRLPRQNFYTAVGQILCYWAEFGQAVVPVIATLSSQINDYVETCCRALGIRLLAVDLLEHTTIVQNHEGYDLVTEKPLLPRKTKK